MKVGSSDNSPDNPIERWSRNVSDASQLTVTSDGRVVPQAQGLRSVTLNDGVTYQIGHGRTEDFLIAPDGEVRSIKSFSNRIVIPLLQRSVEGGAAETYLQQALAPVAPVNTATLAAQNLAFLLGEETGNLPALFTHNPVPSHSTALATGLEDSTKPQELILADLTLGTDSDLATSHGRSGSGLALPIDDAIVIDITERPPIEIDIGGGSSDSDVDHNKYKPQQKRQAPEPKGPSLAERLGSVAASTFAAGARVVHKTKKRVDSTIESGTEALGSTLAGTAKRARTLKQGVNDGIGGAANKVRKRKQNLQEGIDNVAGTARRARKRATAGMSNTVDGITTGTTSRVKSVAAGVRTALGTVNGLGHSAIDLGHTAVEGTINFGKGIPGMASNAGQSLTGLAQTTGQTISGAVSPSVSAPLGSAAISLRGVLAEAKAGVIAAYDNANGQGTDSAASHFEQAKVRLSETGDHLKEAAHAVGDGLQPHIEKVTELYDEKVRPQVEAVSEKVQPHLEAAKATYETRVKPAVETAYDTKVKPALKAAPGKVKEVAEQAGEAIKTVIEVAPPLAKGLLYEARRDYHEEAAVRLEETRFAAYAEQAKHFDLRQTLEKLSEVDFTSQDGITGQDIKVVLPPLLASLDRFRTDDISQLAILQEHGYRRALENLVLVATNYNEPDYRGQAAGILASVMKHSVKETRIPAVSDDAFVSFMDIVASSGDEAHRYSASAKFIKELDKGSGTLQDKLNKFINFLDGAFEGNLGRIFSEPLVQGTILKDVHALLADPLSVLEELQPENAEIESQSYLRSQQIQAGDDISAAARSVFESHLSHDIDPVWREATLAVVRARTDDEVAKATDAFMGQYLNVFKAIVSKSSNIEQTGHLISLADNHLSLGLASEGFTISDTSNSLSLRRLLLSVYTQDEMDRVRQLNSGKLQKNYDHFIMNDSVKQRLEAKLSYFKRELAQERQGLKVNLMTLSKNLDDMATFGDDGEKQPGFAAIFTQRLTSKLGDGLILKDLVDMPDNDTLLNPQPADLDTMPKDGIKRLLVDALAEKRQAYATFQKLQLEQLAYITGGGESSVSINLFKVAKEALDAKDRNFRAAAVENGVVAELLKHYDSYKSFLSERNQAFHELLGSVVKSSGGDAFSSSFLVKYSYYLEQGEEEKLLKHLILHKENLDENADGLGTKLFSMHIKKTKQEITIANKFIEALVAEKRYYAGVGDENYSLAGLLPEAAFLRALGFSLDNFGNYKKLSQLQDDLNKAHFRMEKMVDSASASPVDVAHGVAGDLGESLTEMLQPMLHVLGDADSGTSKLLQDSLKGVQIGHKTNSTHSDSHSLAEIFMAAIMNLLTNFLSSPNNDRVNIPALSHV